MNPEFNASTELRAGNRRAALAGSAAHPQASVVVCTTGRRLSLLRCLDAVLQQDCRGFEILLVINGSASGQVSEALAGYPLRILCEPRPGVSRARNLAIPRARGEILAFLDDDVIPHSNWIYEILRAFEDPAVGCVTGRVIPERSAVLSSEKISRSYASERALSFWNLSPSDPNCYLKALSFPAGFGCNMAFRKSFLEEGALFPVDLGAGSVLGGADEVYMFLQVLKHGHCICHIPTAITTHFYEDSPDGLKPRMAAVYSGTVAFALKLAVEEPAFRWPVAKWVHSGVRRRLDRAFARGVSSEPQEVLSPIEKIRAYLRGPFVYWKSRRSRS